MANQTNNPVIQRALISVSDKTGIVPLARELQKRNVVLLSTGGTAQLLQAAGILTQEVAEYTGFPQIMGGRVKTLHPKIHGGLLARRDLDTEVMLENQILPIDLLIVNLYPFAKTIQQPYCGLETAIEQIDIGGPSMLRAGAKNYRFVTTLVDPLDYSMLLLELEAEHGATTLETRFKLAQKVFAHTAKYDGSIANYLNKMHLDNSQNAFPQVLTMQFTKQQELRYGENPHQQAAFYVEEPITEPSVATIHAHQGKPLSFNNIADTNAALECVKSFSRNAACVIVKHANPCGVALANDQLEAYLKAWQVDPTSAFGGIIAFNQPLLADTAKAILDHQFVEVIIAPRVEDKALTLLASKPNIRVLSCGEWQTQNPYLDYARVNGGLLVQEADTVTFSPSDLKIVSQRQPSVQEFNDLLFAWEVAKHVKSNAIVYAKNETTIGIGAGQMSRVFSAIIAALKARDAQLELSGAVMASDAFLPFRDGVDTAVSQGITAIIQPGGSLRDAEVIKAADEAGIAMVFTGIRHFKH